MSDTISWEDFSKVDIRVGTITDVQPFPEARLPAWKLVVDFGSEIGTRKSSAQIVDLYTKEELLNSQVLAVVNFPPKQIATFMSECLVLGMVGHDAGVVLIQPSMAVPNGLRLG
jgi:tRNA-binding protein